jgi:transcriptional regulator with XRE-family HTH domain
MLGERIRKLRKQKKMTLEALAGNELTKGMLSLIENNKAKPSMESLAYIAEQLEVEVSELLEEISSQELRNILDQAESIYNTSFVNWLDKYEQLAELIEPFVDKLTQGYESARLLELYCYSLAYTKKGDWQDSYLRATSMYDQMNISANKANLGIFRAKQKFYDEQDYGNGLEIFLEERQTIERNHVFIDPITKLNLDYHEAVFYFGVGNFESAVNVMERALHFSKEKKIFYLIDDLYRLAASQALILGDVEKMEYYSNKLKQYGEFADHTHSLMFYKLIKIISHISLKKDYLKALDAIDEISPQLELRPDFKPWFYLEKGKALYFAGRHNEALSCLEAVTIPSDTTHPFDLSLFYVMDSFKALCYLELGNKELALELATKTKDKFEPLLYTPFKAFSLEAYDKIVNS